MIGDYLVCRRSIRCESCKTPIVRQRLVEVVDESYETNHGMGGSVIRNVLVRDALTEDCFRLSPQQLSECQPVGMAARCA